MKARNREVAGDGHTKLLPRYMVIVKLHHHYLSRVMIRLRKMKSTPLISSILVICVYVYIHIYVYIYTNTCDSIPQIAVNAPYLDNAGNMCICIYMYICMYIYVYIHIYVCAYVYIYV